MNQYYPIFIIAFAFIVFAAIQDIRKREVANWLNFSLLAFLLAYRAFYSIINDNYSFFLFGLLGVFLFIGLANLFYYTGVFAGGDAKLLIAFGAILPFQNWSSLIYDSLAFIFLLFLVGAVHGLIYTSFLVLKDLKMFKKDFVIKLKENKYFVIICFILCLILVGEYSHYGWNGYIPMYSIFLLVVLPFIFVYLKTVEGNSLIKLVKPSDLTEGDWLNDDVKIGNRIIKKSVHGLSFKDIEFIKKNNRKVWVKYGVPFVPAFLIAFIIMVCAFLFFQFDFLQLLNSLF